jgi:hypothetical protein
MVNKFDAWRKWFVRPEIFVYLAIGFFGFLFLLLRTGAGYGDVGLVVHYVRLNGTHFFMAGVLLIVGVLLRVCFFYLKAVVVGLDKKNLKRELKNFIGVGRSFIPVGIPFMVAFSVLSLVISPLNIFNSTRLRDELLFQWDVLITGTFPPLSFASIHYPSWFIEAVSFSFLNLVPFLGILGAYMFVARNKLFREAAGAFWLAAIIMVIGWLLFPVLSPHDRFIDNVYNLSAVQEVEQYVGSYAPQQEIQDFLIYMRENKEGLEIFPTSTFPSAHVAWAVFLVYYAWRVHKLLGFAVAPFAILSSIGTFLFAQHYFVDVPAGVITAILVVLAVRWFARKQVEYEDKNSIIGKEI